MFDMNKIGKKISSLRKEKGITQMELADKLGISFQAVSNWERGSTMPDISKLTILAEILDCSIEELLCDEHKGRVVESIANGGASEVTSDDLADIAPIVNSEQFKSVYEQVERQGGNMDIDTIVQIAPFLDEDVLSELVRNNLAKGTKLSDIIALAPFLDDGDLSEIVNGVADENISVEEIACLAPFLSEDALTALAEKYIGNGTALDSLVCLAPHMDGKALAGIVKKIVDKTNDISNIAAVAPFMDEDDLTDIARDYLKKGGSFNDISSVAPFLDMNKLFREFYKK